MTTFVRIADLTHNEQNMLDRLISQLEVKKARNIVRAQYYDGKNALRDLGISTPPTMRNIALVLGWPAKAVDLLNNRCNLDGFTIPDGKVEDFGIPELWRDNRLDIESRKVGQSTFVHSLAFLITTLGDTQSGEPAVVITARDAFTGTGIWNVRRRAIESFLSIINTDNAGQPVEMVMYLPDGNVSMTFNKVWRVERRGHNLGRVPVEMLTFKSSVGRPFGSSRISRPVMGLTDAGIRTMLRSEVTAELYSVPQRVLLGADESQFTDADGNRRSMWQSILGRVWAVERDDDGNVPEMKEFTAATQQPHVDQLRWIVQQFAGETSIPPSSLGITNDANPTSAEAYHASREDLIQTAENATDEWSPAWCRTMLTGVQLRDKLDAVPPELARLGANWRNHATPSRASAADAMVKMISVFPWMADSEVALEECGFSPAQISRLLADKRRAGGSAALAALASAAAAGRPGVTDDGPLPDALA